MDDFDENTGYNYNTADDGQSGKRGIVGKLSLDEIVSGANLAELLPKPLLVKIGERVCEEFEIDHSNFCNTRKRLVEQYIKDCDMDVKLKSYPFEGAANIKYPMLLTAVINYVSIALPALYGDGKIAKFEVNGDDMPMPQGMMQQMPAQEMMGEAANEQGEQGQSVSGFKEQKANRVARAMNTHFKQGNMFNVLDRALQIQAMCGFCVIKSEWDVTRNRPVFTVMMPQELMVDANADGFEKCSRATEEIKYYPYQIEELIRSGVFKEFDYHKLETGIDDEELESDAVEETFDNDEDAPHVFLVQYRTLDLDGDGYAEPYCVTVHKNSRKVVRIYPQFDVDDIISTEDNEIVRIEPMVEYVQMSMIPDVNGTFYAKGLGDLVSMLQHAISMSTNMSIDAMHLGMTGGGLMLKSLKVQGGNLRTQPFQFLRVDGTASDLQDGIREFPRPQPNPVMLNFVELLIKAGGDLSILKRLDLESLPANMPATTTMAAMEQGMQVFKAVFKRVYNSIDHLLSLILRQYRKYLNVQQFVEETGLELYDEDLQGADYDIIPAADPEVLNNTQKFMQAQLLQGMLEHPLVNPVEALKTIFQIAGLDPQKLVVPPKPQEPDPMVMAQIELVKAQTGLAMAQSQSLGVDGQLKVEKLQGELANKESDTKVKEATVVEKMANATHKMTDAGQKEHAMELGNVNTHSKIVLDVAKLEHDREKSSREHELKAKESKKKNVAKPNK